MKIHYAGTPPVDFIFPRGHDYPEYGPEVPPFAVDALLVFAEGVADEESVELLRRGGRPVFRLAPASAPEKSTDLEKWLACLSERPRTNYQPIDCNFYDNFEAAIVQGRKVALAYRSTGDATLTVITRLNNLKTHRTEEYVQLENNEWLRLDRIVSVDGAAAGASCRF